MNQVSEEKEESDLQRHLPSKFFKKKMKGELINVDEDGEIYKGFVCTSYML